MKRYIKITGYAIAAAIFAVALSGCTKKDQAVDPNANKIVVWSFEDEDIWTTVKKEFEKAYKGFELVYQKQTFDSNYENRVLNSILSGQGPDVWAMPNDWVYRHKDKLYPMPAKSAASYNLDALYVPPVKQSVYFDDKIYALSPSAEPLMVYYNDKIFEAALDEYSAAHKGSENSDARKRAAKLLKEIPVSWTDFVETVKLITKKNGGTIERAGVAMGSDKVTNSQDILYLLMLQNETKLTSENIKLATFNLPKETPRDASDVPGLRALDFYTSFANPAHENYSWNDSLGSDIDAFASGKAAMIFGYSSLKNQLAQKYPDFRYKKAFVPQLGVEPEKIVDYARFTAFGVSNLSRNPAPAWGLITVLTDSGDYNSALGLYTSKKASSYDISIKERSSNNPEKLELATAKSFIKGRYPVEFDQAIRNAIYAVNNKVQDSKSALDLAANNITEILRKEGW